MITLLANPNLFAGCYTLHLYCKYDNPAHGWDEFPHSYSHELGSTARRRARKAGWIIHNDGTATCPRCADHLKGNKS